MSSADTVQPISGFEAYRSKAEKYVMAAKTVQKVVDGLYWIVAREGLLPDSNIYLVKVGERFVIFDTGISNFFRHTYAAIEELGFNVSQLDRMILTHTHLDHSGSAPLFLREAKDAEVWVSKQEGDYLEKGDDTVVYGSFLGQRLEPVPVGRKLQEGDVVKAGDFTFQVLHTPGHSIGSLCFFEPRQNILISGDVVFRHGSFGRVDLPTGNPQQLIASIFRLAQLPVEILLPGHMSIATSNGQAEIQLSLQFAKQVL
ncbi:MAG: MBL fold metallo-hydrolase [Promethearchaeota archaeon]